MEEASGEAGEFRCRGCSGRVGLHAVLLDPMKETEQQGKRQMSRESRFEREVTQLGFLPSFSSTHRKEKKLKLRVKMNEV